VKILLLMCLALGLCPTPASGVPAEAKATPGTTLFGVIRMPVGTNIRIERHSQVREGVVEAVIRGLDEGTDLNSVLSGRTNPYVAAMETWYSGGGTWVVKAMMRKPEWDLRIVVDGGYLVIEVVEGIASIADAEEKVLTVQSLVSGDVPTPASKTKFPQLIFLHGNALSYAMNADDFVPLLPVPAALPRPNWFAIDRARTAMLAAQTEVALAQARYELGWLYLEKGFNREGRYYFELLSDNAGALRPVDVALARARSALACARWDEARDRLREAYRFGARESAIVEGFGVVSLETGVPGRALTAKVMARVTGRPEALLLAAELLQRDGYYAESRSLLESLTGRVEGITAERVALRLGDARIIGGESDAAVRAYRDAPAGLSEVRVLYVDLLTKGSLSWAASIPRLSLFAKEKGEVGAEALYLLSQIDTQFGTRVDAVTDLAQLIRKHRTIAMASDVPERLWEVYKERQNILLGQEKWFDAASLHEGAWHPMLRRAVDDTSVLVGVAHAYEQIGLPQRALALTRDVWSVLLRGASDDTDLLINMTRLYHENGDTLNALETLKYLRRNKVPADRLADTALLAATIHEANGHVPAMVKELRAAARDPRHRERATLWMARVDAEAGRCDAATSVLWGTLMSPEGRAKYTESRPYLALARCLAAKGDGARAAQAAKAAAGRSDSAEESRYATYLAAVASGWKDGIAREALTEGEDVWAALSQDHARAKAFSVELEKRKIFDPLSQ
jgi:hypothetical protein